MYLRESRRANRDGSVVAYLQLAHNQRHPQTGTSTAKVIGVDLLRGKLISPETELH